MGHRIALVILIVVLNVKPAQSQSIANIKLEWNYNGSLDNVLKAIGDDYHLTFIYDSLQLRSMQVQYYAFEENKLKQLFQEWKNRWNLYCYVEKNRTVLISDKPLKGKERKARIAKPVNDK